MKTKNITAVREHLPSRLRKSVVMFLIHFKLIIPFCTAPENIKGGREREYWRKNGLMF